MSKAQLLFTAFFIILIVIILGEVISYGFNSVQCTQTAPVQPKNSVLITLNKANFFIPYNAGMTVEQDLKTLFKTISLQKIVNTLHQIQLLPRTTVVSSEWATVYKGTIAKVQSGPSTVKGKTTPISFWVEIGKGDNKTTAFYQDKELSLLSVYSGQDKAKKPMRYQDLKVGDTIEIREVYNVKTDTLVEVQITKL